MSTTIVRNALNPGRPAEGARPRRALVAVADESRRLRLKEELSGHGFEVSLARTHGEAVRFARRHPVAVAVLDADPLKLQSGWLACRKITFRCHNTRAVIVGTRSATPELGRLAEFSGATGYFDESASVGAIVREAIRRAGMAS